MTKLRSELPRPLPPRIARLPLDHRGYPVPWFAAWIDDDGKLMPRGQGNADHRVLYPDATAQAIVEQRCWICGERRGNWGSFLIGPMCAVNRISAEPPSHDDCAQWAVRACPFLTRPHAQRRTTALPDHGEAAGIMLDRNPGVTLLWATRHFEPFRVQGNGQEAQAGILIRVGDAERTEWFCEGRPATREEVVASMDSGLPTLLEYAEQDGDEAVAALGAMVLAAMELVPA